MLSCRCRWLRLSRELRAIGHRLRVRHFALGLILLVSILAASSGFVASVDQSRGSFITLASTTSAQDTGLLDSLLPIFRGLTELHVHVIAVGTGQALALGSSGNADALLVHDPLGERKFVADGDGIDRRDVMYNNFVIVGPSSDPAGIRGLKDARDAFRQIAASGALFVSRADDSGTNRRELRLWQSIGILPDQHSGWFRESRRGMGATLTVAAALRAYTLTDRGTWANSKNREQLEILSGGDPLLLNRYSSILVNPAKWPNVKYRDARIWHEWLTSKPGREAITSYNIYR